MDNTLHSCIRKMLALGNTQANLPEGNFKEKVRCGEVYRNLNGNEMFQKFYYRCLECSLDFESSPEFEEHVIAHYLQDDDEDCTTVDNSKNNENVISISSGEDEEEEENGYLYAFEVASLVEENISENDLPLPLMQMLSEQSADSCDQAIQLSESDEDDERSVVFPCDGLRKQALHQYSEHCCTQCPAYFNNFHELNLHLHIHKLPNTVVCPHCYEAFANAFKLNEHISLTKKKKIRKNNKERRNENENTQNSKRAKNQTHEQEHKKKQDQEQEEEKKQIRDPLQPNNAMDVDVDGNGRFMNLNEINNLADSVESSGEIISSTNITSNCQKNNSNDCDPNVNIKNVSNDT